MLRQKHLEVKESNIEKQELIIKELNQENPEENPEEKPDVIIKEPKYYNNF